MNKTNGGLPKNRNFEKYGVYDSTNCYAYALDCDKNPVTGKSFYHRHGDDCQPGTLGRTDIATYENPSPYATLKHIRQDMKRLGWKFRKVSLSTVLSEGWFRIAFCFEDHIGMYKDYHFYRQNINGTWSHKIGFCGKPMFHDESGRKIHDPESCDRGKYKVFVGYFAVLKG